MNSGYTTIITTIRPNQTDALKRFLRCNVEPQFDPANILKCRSIRFDKIQSLHFCSFIVLDGDEEFEPSLVFEATFDGARDDFLHALLHVAPNTMEEIYQHCKDYPVSGHAVPELFKNYLADHDVGAQTFFRGSPGRTVAQIKGEARIHDKLATYVCDRWRWRINDRMPTTFAGFQHELQRRIRKQPANRWAEQMAAVPWEVAGRRLVAGAAILAFLVLTCGIGALVVGLFGQGPSQVDDSWANYAGQLGKWLFGTSGVNDVSCPIRTSLPLLALVVAWLVFRFIELIFSDEDPRQESFWWRFFIHILVICRYAALVFLVGFSALLLDPNPKYSPDPKFTEWAASIDLSALWVILLLTGTGFVFLLLKHWATSLKLVVQFQKLKPKDENIRRWLLDLARFGTVLLALFALFVIGSSMPHEISVALGAFLLPFTRVLLVWAVYLFAGLMTIYVIGLLLFLVLRRIESGDRNRFGSAEELINVDNSGVYAREEGGINTYQNHLASLTYVKPGLLRVWFLWLTLFVIGLLSRFWFNIGELGGIRTILSARWVMIDGGKRLLFLDNYGGAWDSYLNEFIDMGAVKGLNAIWTNTFVKAADAEYGFPETTYYFWKGAQMERPFKAYVRRSQIETIVWYSAYPKPSTVNINANTNLRQSLFKSLASYEIDSLFQNL